MSAVSRVWIKGFGSGIISALGIALWDTFPWYTYVILVPVVLFTIYDLLWQEGGLVPLSVNPIKTNYEQNHEGKDGSPMNKSDGGRTTQQDDNNEKDN